jgi:RecA-family ATPase
MPQSAKQPPAGGPTPTPNKFESKLLTRSALRNLPPQQPLIKNVLDRGTVALLYGHWGTLKTFIAVDWAASIATGRNWQGLQTERLRVLYVAGEGAQGYQSRVDAWESGWQTKLSDTDMIILPEGVNLTDNKAGGDVAELIALIKRDGYGMVVFDTLARCMVGADENSSKDCGIVIASLGQLREATPNGAD